MEKKVATNLFDKNKKEVCEGNIVRHFFNGQFYEETVIYKYGSFRYKGSDLHVGYSTDGEMAEKGNYTEIIGSIYD